MFCFPCTSRLLKLGDFAEYLSKIPYLLPVSMSLPYLSLTYTLWSFEVRGTDIPCVGKPHQTFPNQFFHQITDIDSSRAQKRKWETLQKNFVANSTQCSQAVTHPSTD